MRQMLLLTCLALAACSERAPTPIVPAALQVGTLKSVFVMTNRAPATQGQFGFERSFTSTRMRLTVSIPPEREAGTISDGQDRPNPVKDFALAARSDYEERAAFRADIARSVRGTDGQVALFVHGYNNGFSDPAFRISQLAHDLELQGTLAAFSWPSRGNVLGYEYDDDSTMFSRDPLQDMLLDVASANPRELILVAHSMGSFLLMETLRQIELQQPGWTARNVDGVILMSPDLGVDVFRAQVRAFQDWPQPFVIFVSGRDRVLQLSAVIRGEEVRLGNLTDPTPLENLPVQIIDISAFEDRKSGNHFTVAGSPALLKLLNAAQELNRDFARARGPTVLSLPGTRRVLRNASQIQLIPPG